VPEEESGVRDIDKESRGRGRTVFIEDEQPVVEIGREELSTRFDESCLVSTKCPGGIRVCLTGANADEVAAKRRDEKSTGQSGILELEGASLRGLYDSAVAHSDASRDGESTNVDEKRLVVDHMVRGARVDDVVVCVWPREEDHGVKRETSKKGMCFRSSGRVVQDTVHREVDFGFARRIEIGFDETGVSFG